MSGVVSDTIGGYNKFLSDQKDLEGRALLTLVLFDHNYELVFDRVDISRVPKLDSQTYQIGGTTALNDAIGKTVNNLYQKITKTKGANVPSRILFLIITDGLENASREFTTKQVQEIVNDKREHYGWEFIFLGANIDSFAVGATLGTQYNSNFTQNTKGVSNLYETISLVTTQYRVSGTIDKDWDKKLNEDQS